ncbi:MAG: AAA family ATPase, partial [Proteobacteria bacterium]|nr:AAA family ATPase [Pseudomonadota bacterium]
DVCIHDKGDNNPHAHVMFTFREINGNEFCKTKLRNLMPQVRGHSSNYFVIADQLSQQWEDYQNQYFQKHDIDLVVDQGHIKPTIHEGRIGQPDNYAETQSQKNVEIIKENIEAVKENHEIIVETLEKRQAVFSQRDIENLIFKSTESKEDYNDTLAKVLESKGLVSLGYYNEAGRLSFTTKHTYEKEVNLARMSNEMSGVHAFNIHGKIIDEIAAHKDFTLFDEQKSALTHIVNSGQIVALVGIAGAGKTRTMKALKAVYDTQGIHVSGAAMAGKAEHGLQSETSIKSQTIYRILDNYRKGEANHKYLPRQNSVLVIDEAGMIGLEDMYDLVKMSQERNIKLVLVGDPDQLQPVAHGAPFRAILERIGFAEMTDVRRQKDELDRVATQSLAKGEISLAVDHYLKKDRLVLDDDSVIKKQLLSTWQDYINEKPENTLILAFKNEQVTEINALARDYLKQQSVLGESKSFNVSLSGKDEVREFAANDRIIFLKNKNLGDVKVKNGQLATIVSIENDIVTFRLDDDKDAKDVKNYQFNAKEFNNFDHGYCATVHKSQGVSVENCLVYAKGRGWDRFLSYVAMSRHKINMHFFADKDTYKDIHTLKRELSRSPLRDNVLDYPLQFAIRRGRDAQTFAGNAVSKIRGAYHKTRDTWNYLFNYEEYKASKAAFDREAALNEKLNAQQELNKEARAVADLADLHIDSGQRYSEFVEKYGKKWYENVEAKAAYKSEIGDLFYERNKAAFAVFTKADKYERALELNNISIEKLEEWANAYIAESRVRAFGDSTNPYEKGKLAQEIVNTKDESASYVSRQELWQAVNKYQGEHALRMKAGQIQGFSACLKDVEEYLSLGKTAANYWKKSQADHFDSFDSNAPFQKDSRGKEIKPEHQQHYEKLSRAYNQKCEILAAKIMADFDSYSKVFAVKFPHAATHDKIIERLKANADRHARREVIRSYINPKSTQAEIEKAAFALNSDFRGYVGLGFEEGLIWANVGKLAQVEKLRQFKANLSPGNQVRFDRVEAYRLSVVATGKAYGEVQEIEQALKLELGIPEKGDIPHDQVTEALQNARETMYKVIADCHEVAYDLAQDYPQLAKWAKNAPEKLLEVHPYFEKLSRPTKAANQAKGKQQSTSNIDAPQEAQEKTMAELQAEVKDSLEKQKAQLERADDLNKSKVNTVKADKFTRHILLHAERLEAQERVENFVTLSKQPSNDANCDALASLAYEMTDRIHKHRFFLKQVEVNERDIWHLSQVHQYNLDNAELTGDDKVVHRALADYMLSRSDSSRAWSDYRAAKTQGQLSEPELEQLQKHAFNLSTERNRLAFAASKLLGANINSAVLDAFTFSGEEIDLASKDNDKLSSKALHARIKRALTRANKQNLNLQTLIKEAQSYSIIDAIERYKLEETGSYKARSIAGEASEQYNRGQLYHKLKELGADSNAFYSDAVTFRREQYRANLTADERQAHDIVMTYAEKSNAAYQAYKSKDEALNKALMPEIEKLAAQIVQSYSYYEDALLFES